MFYKCCITLKSLQYSNFLYSGASKSNTYRALRGGGGGGGMKKPGMASTPSTPAKMDGIPAGLSTASAGQMAAQAAEKATAASEAAKATLEQAKNVAQVSSFHTLLLQQMVLHFC